jgi:hypothetical protein
LYQASSYFIKNSTGEILLFKTINQKAFQEIQPDEEYPLDFQSLQNFDKILKSQNKETSVAPERRKSGSMQKRLNKNRDILHDIQLFEKSNYNAELKGSYDGSSNDEDEDTDSHHLFSDESTGEEPGSEEDDLLSATKESLILYDEDEQGHCRSIRAFNLKNEGDAREYNIHEVASRSIYRRRNYKFLKSEPKKVQFQVLI